MKRIFVVIPLLVFFFSVQAQYKPGAAQFTVTTGTGVVWGYTDSPVLKTGAVSAGISPGIHMDYYFRPHFAFSTGVNWEFFKIDYQLLADAEFSFLSGPQTVRAGEHVAYHMQVIEWPLGLKMSSREIGYTTLFVDAGVSPMWFINPTASTTDGVADREPAMKEVKDFDLGYHAAAGFKYSFGNKTCLVFSLYYKNTFLDFTTDFLTKPDDNSRINQAGIRIGFGF